MKAASPRFTRSRSRKWLPYCSRRGSTRRRRSRALLAAAGFREGEKIRRQIRHIFRRERIWRHHRSRRERIGIGEMLFHPTAAATLREAIQRRSDLRAVAIHHVASAALVRLIDEGAGRGEIGSVAEGAGVGRSEFQRSEERRVGQAGGSR